MNSLEDSCRSRFFSWKHRSFFPHPLEVLFTLAVGILCGFLLWCFCEELHGEPSCHRFSRLPWARKTEKFQCEIWKSWKLSYCFLFTFFDQFCTSTLKSGRQGAEEVHPVVLGPTRSHTEILYRAIRAHISQVTSKSFYERWIFVSLDHLRSLYLFSRNLSASFRFLQERKRPKRCWMIWKCWDLNGPAS